MDELFELLEAESIKPFLEKIFDGLDIVVGYSLDFLYSCGVLDVEIFIDFTEFESLLVGHLPKAGQGLG